MLVLLHVLIALASIIYTAYVYFYPSAGKLPATYALFVLTFLTGTYLVWSKPGHLTESCISGLIYFALVSYGIVAARQKLSV
jgi:hypothetical protein